MPTIDCHAHFGPWPFPVPTQSIAEIEALLAQFGIERGFLASTVALAGDLAGGNALLAEAIASCAALRGYVVVNPYLLEDSLEQIATYLGKSAFCGVRMDGGHRGLALDSPEVKQILKALLRYDKPILLRLDDEYRPDELVSLAKEFATAKFIIAEMGGREWQPLLRLAKPVTNLHVECGGGAAERDKLAMAVETLGSRRVLFGTGSPLMSPIFALGMVRDSQLPAADKDQILYQNAKRLFGM
jgi:predicted TIM-barrel fold metal-dependent hydrolase